MEHTKRKFLLELENYINNFEDYTIGDILYSLLRNVGDKKELLTLSDEEIINKLEQTQFIETEN